MHALLREIEIFAQQEPKTGCIPSAVRSVIRYLGCEPPDEESLRVRMLRFGDDTVAGFQRMAAVLPQFGFQLRVSQFESPDDALTAIGEHLDANRPALVCAEFFDSPPNNGRRIHCFVVLQLDEDSLELGDAGTGLAESWSVDTFRQRFTGDIAVVERSPSPVPQVG